MNAEEQFLSEINKTLPEGIDWKTGAIEYLDKLFDDSPGKGNEIYHFVKPFIGGPDFSSFYYEMYGFLNVLEKINPSMNSSILDVGCGSGWVSHYLAKLGHQVHGIDISNKCVEMSKRRLEQEPFTAYEGVPLNAEFYVHDIEEGVFDCGIKYDIALFDSTLHHFYNPIAVLKNVAASLKEEGLICSWEACAIDEENPFSTEHLEIMKRYRTLERPYSRRQMCKLLELTGFQYYEFYSQVNGYFNMQNPKDVLKLEQQCAAGNFWNIFAASRSRLFFDQ